MSPDERLNPRERGTIKGWKWTIIPGLLLLTGATVGMLLQTPTQTLRDARRFAEIYEIPNVEAGVVSAEAGSTALEWNLSDVTGVVASYQLPFTRHGGLQYLGGTSRRFLLSGSTPGTSGRGTILLLEIQKSPVKKIVSVATPVDLGIAVDPAGIAWNAIDGYLYVLDTKGKKLLAAPWAGGNAPLPTAFATAADSISEPRLLHADILEIIPADGEKGVYLIHEALFSDPMEKNVRIYYEATSWRSSSTTPTWSSPLYKISSKSLTNSRGPLWLMGPAGICRILDDSLNEVAALSLPGGQGYQMVTLPDPNLLIPGARYRIVWPDASDSGSFRPMVRYGSPQSSGDVHLGGPFANSRSAFVGSNYFGVVIPAWIKPIPPAPFERKLNVYLHVAARLPSGADPVVVTGEAAILQPISVMGPWDHKVGEAYPHIKIAQRLRIADDPAMIGSVILWQWVVTWGEGQIAYSEVFGTTIFDGESSYEMNGASTQSSSAKSAFAGPRNSKAPARLKPSVVAAAQKWLGSPGGVLPKKNKATVQALLKAMFALANAKK